MKFIIKVTVALYSGLFITVNAIAATQHSDFNDWKIERKGAATVYVPPNIRQGEYYNISLFKVEKVYPEERMNWFRQFVARDESTLGKPYPAKITYRGKPARHDAGILSTIRNFDVSTGLKDNKVFRGEKIVKHRVAIYMLEVIGENKVGVKRIIYSNRETFDRLNKYALAKVSRVMRLQGDTAYMNNEMANYEKEKKRLVMIEKINLAEKEMIEEEKKQKETAKIKALWTEPNKGLKPSQVEAVTYYMNYRTSVYGVDVYYKEYLLLKDGWAYTSPTIPPSSFNAKASRQLEPDRWIKWRKKGGQYQLNSSNEWSDLDGDAIKPAKKLQTLDAYLSSTESWALGGVAGGHSSKFLNLAKNGRFESSMYTVNVGQATDLVKYESRDKEGRRTIGSGGGFKTSSRTNEGSSDRTGTYTLNGYTIELRHDSGRVSQMLFGFTWGGEKYIYVNGTNYKNAYYED